MADAPTLDLHHVRALLREDKVQEADNLISQHLAAQPAPQGASGEAKPAPAPKRPAEEVHTDLLDAIISHLGAPPRLVALFEEFRQALERL